MVLTVEDVVTHYVLSSHPKNKAIVDIKEKDSGIIKYIKIRHRLSKFYAVSLVDPRTFEVQAETQVKSASSKLKTILLHCPATEQQQQQDTSVELKDTSKIGFEWCFTWEGERYKWNRESRMSNSLECRAIRKTGNICVAQYLPCTLKDEYFGIISLFGYNMLRCNLTKSVELELIILMSLMTLLDKSNDTSWKRDLISKGFLQEDAVSALVTPPNGNLSAGLNDNLVYDDLTSTKAQQKKNKSVLLNEQKLQFRLEKEARRSQKQIQTDILQKHNYNKISLSADNSPTQTPKCSPLPTPSTSSNRSSLRLKHRKSVSAMNAYCIDLEEDHQERFQFLSEFVTATAPSTSPSFGENANINRSNGFSNIGTNKLARFFNNLSNKKQQRNKPSTTTSSSSSVITITPAESPTIRATASSELQEIVNDAQLVQNRNSTTGNDVNKQFIMNNKVRRSSTRTHFDIPLSQNQTLMKNQYHRFTRRNKGQSQEDIPMVTATPELFDRQLQQQQYIDYIHYQNHHLSLPTNINLITDDYGRLSLNHYNINNSSQQPPSLKNICWNTAPTTPLTSAQSQQQQQQQQQQQILQQRHRRSQSQRDHLLQNLSEHRRISLSEYPTYSTAYDATTFVDYSPDDYFCYYSSSSKPQPPYEYWPWA